MLESFLNKVAGQKPATLLERDSLYFPVNTAKFLRAGFFIEHIWWLLLNFFQNLLKITVKKIISQQNFSQKFFRNHFLVLAATFLKMTHLQVFHSFCLSLSMSEAYLEPSQISRLSLLLKLLTAPEVYSQWSRISKMEFFL